MDVDYVVPPSTWKHADKFSYLKQVSQKEILVVKRKFYKNFPMDFEVAATQLNQLGMNYYLNNKF